MRCSWTVGRRSPIMRGSREGWRRHAFTDGFTKMTQAGVYGQRLGQGFHLKQAPVLITRSLHSAALAVTEVRNDDPTPDISGSLAAEDAYLVSLKFRDYPDCECWEQGRCVTKADVRPGMEDLYALKGDPR